MTEFWIFLGIAVIIVCLDWGIMLYSYRKWARGLDRQIKEIREKGVK